MAKLHGDYTELQHGAALAEEATAALSAGLERKNGETTRQLRRVRAEAERHRDAFLKRLEREFVPPMDRRDLAALAERLCAVSGAAEDAYAALERLPSGDYRAAAAQITAKLAAGGGALAELIRRLPDYQKPEILRPLESSARRQAAEAARACGEAIGALAQSVTPSGPLIARYEAYTRLRACADCLAAAAETAAHAALNNM